MDERFKYKLRVIASDISQERLIILPQDIIKYGIEPSVKREAGCSLNQGIRLEKDFLRTGISVDM